MSLGDTIAAALKTELTSNLDAQYAALPLTGLTTAFVAVYTWDGTTTVLTGDTSEVSEGDFIRLDSDGQWFEVQVGGITTDVSVVVTNTYSVVIPSGATTSSKADVPLPPPLTGTSSIDPFADGIGDAFAATPHQLPSTTVAGVPAATPAGRIIYVSNAAGGGIPCFSDGANWRRFDTRAVVV